MSTSLLLWQPQNQIQIIRPIVFQPAKHICPTSKAYHSVPDGSSRSAGVQHHSDPFLEKLELLLNFHFALDLRTTGVVVEGIVFELTLLLKFSPQLFQDIAPAVALSFGF